MIEVLYYNIIKESTVSSYERALLVGNYHALNVKDTINPRIKDLGYTKEQLKILESKTIVRQTNVRSCGLSFNSDITQFNCPNFGYYLEAFYAYDNHGILPFKGSFTEQPSKILDIFEIIKQIQTEEETKIRKRVESNNKRKK